MKNKLLPRWWGNYFDDPPLRWQLPSLEMMRRWCNSFRVLPLPLFDDNNDYDEVMIVMMWWCNSFRVLPLPPFCEWWSLVFAWSVGTNPPIRWRAAHSQCWSPTVMGRCECKTKDKMNCSDLYLYSRLGGYKDGHSRREQWRWWKTYRV